MIRKHISIFFYVLLLFSVKGVNGQNMFYTSSFKDIFGGDFNLGLSVQNYRNLGLADSSYHNQYALFQKSVNYKDLNFELLRISGTLIQKSEIVALDSKTESISPSKVESKYKDIQFSLVRNPVTDILIISASKPLESLVHIRIYNLRGEMIFQSNQYEPSPENTIIQFNISSIPSGTYIYTIRTVADAGSGKFIKK